MNNAVLHLALARSTGSSSGSNIRFYQSATGSYKECTSAPAGVHAVRRLLTRPLDTRPRAAV